MKRVISFSLWGDSPIYLTGAVENAKDALTMYPEFECWFYIHESTVPKKTVQELRTIPNVKIIMKQGDLSSLKSMTWRFEAIDDPEVELMLSRDTDTRFLLREKMAVDAWLTSDSLFHIMRDHPHHAFYILGGMFGTRKIPNIPSWKVLIDTIHQTSSRDYDQTFLKDYIYPKISHTVMIHSSFHIYGSETANPFPIPYDSEFHFVGEYVNADKTRSEYHTTELRKAVNKNVPLRI